MSSAVQLDRAGIFRAKPFDWSIQPSTKSKSIAVSVGLLVLAQYEDGQWTDWAPYEPHQTRGWWYVVGKNGQVNTTAVEQLVKSLGWNGDLKAVTGPVPDVVVQVTVKAEEYNGETNYKAGWMNPEDFVPESSGASEDDVAKLSVQFGSLLRAAAAAAKPAAKKPAPAKPRTAPPAAKSPGLELPTAQPAAADDVPF